MGLLGRIAVILCLFSFSAEAATLFSAGKVYNITRIRKEFGRNVAVDWRCRSDIPASPSVFAPPRDKSSTKSVDENKNYMQPLRDFDFRLSTIATDYLRSSVDGLDIANCALKWLDTWARKDFMVKEPKLSPSSQDWWQLQYERAFLAASLAQHYAAVAGEPGVNEKVKNRVESWLVRVAQKTHDFSIYREKNDKTYRYNNIYAWMGLHMLVTGLATGDKKLKSRGLHSFYKAATRIRTDGLISTELLRASDGKSFWYHNYFLRPMFMMAEIMVNHGVNLYQYRASDKHGTIYTAGKRVISAFDTNLKNFPDGNKQVSTSLPSYFMTDNTGQLDWMEIYRRRYSSDNRTAPLLVRARAVWKDLKGVAGGTLKSRSGPNGTVSFGVRSP